MNAEAVLSSYGPDDPARFLVAADAFLLDGHKRLAASALDRAFALCPDDKDIARQRAAILDELALTVHGLVFRYVPAGTFLMGSEDGDPDERPVHPRRLDDFWICQVPISWAAFCRLLEFAPPPDGSPPDDEDEDHFAYHNNNRIRLQYCEDETTAARDWHAHAGQEEWEAVPRTDASKPETYETKPMIAVSVAEAEALAAALSFEKVVYTLPTEAEWEKAARGGRAGSKYSWGDAPPTLDLCDFGRMGDFRLRDPKTLPPNGYGIYGMCGGVLELTADTYDALAYHRASRGDLSPAGTARVLRGGSFTDCADAVTVSFRTAHGAGDDGSCPNIGFRLVRRVL